MLRVTVLQVNRLRGSGCANQTDVEYAWAKLLQEAIHKQLANDNERMDGRGLINTRTASYQVPAYLTLLEAA